MGPGTPLQISNRTPLHLKVCCCVPERPGHTSAPAGPTPPTGPCVWQLLRLRCAPATARSWVTHILTVAGLLPGAQLGIITAAAPTPCQPGSTASTLAILAQGTKWADASASFFSNGSIRPCEGEQARPPTLGILIKARNSQRLFERLPLELQRGSTHSVGIL